VSSRDWIHWLDDIVEAIQDWEHLAGLKTVYVEQERREGNVFFLNPEQAGGGDKTGHPPGEDRRGPGPALPFTSCSCAGMGNSPRWSCARTRSGLPSGCWPGRENRRSAGA